MTIDNIVIYIVSNLNCILYFYVPAVLLCVRYPVL